MPLVFGVQRFSTSSGLASNQSALQSGVADSMGWANGQLNLFGSPPSSADAASPSPPTSTGRRLADDLADSLHAWTTATELWAREQGSDFGRRLAAKKATTESVDVSGVDIASGELGSGGLIAAPTTPVNLALILDSLVTMSMALPAILLVQLLTLWHWRYRMNRRYYQELLLPPLPLNKDEDPKDPVEDKGRRLFWICGPRRKKKPQKAARFIPMPGIFVFPSFLVLGFSFFTTGLVNKGVGLVVECRTVYTEVQYSCMAPGIVVLLLVASYIVMNFTLLLHFHFRYRKASWEPLVLPDHPNDIEDPLMRLISRIRFSVVGRCHLKCGGPQKVLVDRPRGEYMRPWDEVEEPGRTERLLARPFILYKDNVTDAIDSMKLLMMNRASGFSFRGLSYDLYTFCAQLLVAILTGLAPVIPVGSHGAMLQMYAVLFVQWFSASYILFVQPSVDRFDGLIQCAQFSIEGTMTLMLILSTIDTNADSQLFYQSMAFYLALGAMGVPILEKVYDAVIVQLSKLLRKDEFTWQGCFFALIALLISLPSVIASLLGVDLGLSDLETIVDEGAGAMEMGLEDMAIVTGAGFDAAADLFSNVAWLNNPLPRHHKAAVKIQRFRRQAKLLQKSTQHRAASRLQAAVRGKKTRREYEQKVGSIPDVVRKLHSVDRSNARRTSMMWLDATEQRDYYIADRLGRARAQGDLRRASSFSRTTSGATMAHDLWSMPQEAAQPGLRRCSVSSRLRAPPAPGVTTLRDDMVSGVGIVYTRARPGRQDPGGLRSAATRLKQRVAKKALPAAMPPRPPTLTGAGGDFAQVVNLARARKKMVEDLKSLQAGGSQVLSAATESLETLSTSVGAAAAGSLDTLTASVGSVAMGSFDTLTAGVGSTFSCFSSSHQSSSETSAQPKGSLGARGWEINRGSSTRIGTVPSSETAPPLPAADRDVAVELPPGDSEVQQEARPQQRAESFPRRIRFTPRPSREEMTEPEEMQEARPQQRAESFPRRTRFTLKPSREQTTEPEEIQRMRDEGGVTAALSRARMEQRGQSFPRSRGEELRKKNRPGQKPLRGESDEVRASGEKHQ